MATNVIDALVVTLGLNAKGFSQGIKGSTEELAGFTRKLLGMFLAVQSLEDVIGYFKDLHRELASIGFSAMSLGVAGKELTRLGEVSELFGGQMGDAAQSVETLQASLFNLKYNGQMSEQLLMLQRFGVAYMNTRGQMLDMQQIAENAARRMDQLRASGMSQGMRYQLALQMGFSGGLATAVSQGSGALNKHLREATRDQKSLTEKSIQSQVGLSRELTRNSAQLMASSSVILAQLTPAIEALTKEFTQLVTYLEHKLEPFLKTWIPRIDADLKAFADFVKRLFGEGSGGKKDAANEPWYERVPKEIAHGVGLTGLGELLARMGKGKFGFLEAGSAAASGHYAAAGKFALSALSWQVAAGMMLNEFLKRETPRLNSWGALFGGTPAMASAGAFAGASGRWGLPATPASTLGRSAGKSGAAAAPGAIAYVGGGGTNVEVGSITINTAATDANSIAAGISSALKRKLLVTNADQGQR